MELKKSLDLYDRARRLIPGASQTNSKRPQAFAFGAYPIYARRAYGNRIEDVDGNVYVDLVNAFGPIILGYDYHPVTSALQKQIDEGVIAGLMFPEEVEVAERLASMVPCAEMVRYLKGGGEATAAAARICRGYTGRDVILSCGYRGWPDVWAVGSRGVPAALGELTHRFPFADLPALEQLLKQHEGKVSAVFIDVLDQVPPAGYLEGVKKLAESHGALFVLDEIVTGFRLAPGGAQEYLNVIPDVACFAKAVANGMPLAVVAGRRDVMEVAADLLISITYGGEALSLAAAAATLQVIAEEPVTEHLWSLGSSLMVGLDQAAAAAGIPFKCRGFAPMSFMEFDGLPEAERDDVWHFFLQEMAERGVLMRRTGANLITYSFTQSDIDMIVEQAAEVFRELASVLKTKELAKRLRSRPDSPREHTGMPEDRSRLGR